MALSGLALCTVLLGVVYVTTALPTYRLPEEYRQQSDLQGYGAPYEQLKNRDFVEMAWNTCAQLQSLAEQRGTASVSH